MKNYELVIIGGGPAGLSAAIYAARANIQTLIIEKSAGENKLAKISTIENYPGFESISGFDLYTNMQKQVANLNVETLQDQVTNIDEHTLKLLSGNEIAYKALIIATGSSQRTLDIKDSKEYAGKGISYCATCDGFFFRNKPVVVIAETSNALQEIIYLAKLVSKLTVITKKDKLVGEESLITQINKYANVEILFNKSATDLVIENNKIVGLNIVDINTNKIDTIIANGIFPYISFNPSTDILDSNLLDDKGYIKVKDDMSTGVEYIFAAGDCCNRPLKQIVTACSDGAIAATSVIKYIKNN